MFRFRLVKGFIMGMGLAMVLSTAAFAEQVPGEVFTIQITNVAEETEALPPDAPVSSDGQTVIPADKNGAAVSGLAGGGENGSSIAVVPAVAEPSIAPDAVKKEMYDKQLEADRYLFADHTEEIAAKGITVTHTAATNEYVEIGITPFNEENAEFIYDALGREQIKVIEGTMNVIFETGAADGEKVYKAELYNGEVEAISAPADDQRAYMTANTVSASAESTNLIAALSAAAAAAVLLGGALFILRRRKMARN